jgi:hypothetical protein
MMIMTDGDPGETSRPDDAPVAKTIELDAGGPNSALDSDTVRVEAIPTEQVRYVGGAAPVPPRPNRRGPNWAGPTMGLPAEVDGPPAYVDSGSPRWSHRMRWWITAAAAAVLVIAAVAVVMRFRTDQSPAAQTVQEYIADLASGDTKSALSLVDDAEAYGTDANPLLSAAALSKPASRPSAARIAKSAPTTVDGDRDAVAVTVTYTVDGTQVQQTIIATASESAKSYLLKSPFMTVTVSGAKGRPVKVNGIGMPDGATQLRAFPGAYGASIAGSDLVAPATAPAIYDSSNGGVTANIYLPAPTIAAGASAVVQTAVNHALDACAASTSPSPQGCPFRYGDSGADMKWTIATYPKVKARIGGDGTVTFDDGGHLGAVHYEATTGGFLGLFPSTKSGDIGVDVSGTATLGSDGVAVSFGSGR